MNSYNRLDLTFPFEEVLSLIIERISSKYNKAFLFSLVITLKLQKDCK